MCVDYRRVNKLQPEVTKADGEKGCISLIPLPKIDELYTKLKGYKFFSSLDLRSGYYHIGLTESVNQSQHLYYHPLVNTSLTEFHLALHRHQHTSRNSIMTS